MANTALEVIDAPSRKRLDAPLPTRQWRAEYVDKAFDGPWRAVYEAHVTALVDHYGRLADAPQYYALCSRLAVLLTEAARMDVQRTRPTEERMQVEDRIRSYVAQLQRYTEAERRVEVRIDVERVRVIERLVAVAEATLHEPTELHRLLDAWQVALMPDEDDDVTVQAKGQRAQYVVRENGKAKNDGVEAILGDQQLTNT